MDVPLSVNRTDAKPLYKQIEDVLRQRILEGVLRPGVRLPSIRTLAASLGVARVTVITAYEQLMAEGYIESRTGIGSVVANQLPEHWMRARGSNRGAHQRSGVTAQLPPRNPHVPTAAFFERPGFLSGGARAKFDFSTGSTNLDLFPSQLWERMLRLAWRELDRAGSTATHYRESIGDPRLRQALATYLGASRAVRCLPDDVIVTSGALSAMSAASRLWLNPNRTYAVEDPGGPNIWRAFELSGAERVGVPVDDQGIEVAKLPEEAALILVTPSWQYPSGGTLSLTRRLELLGAASDRNAVIVEDDCDSELRYSGHPIASLQGLDDEGRVLYVGTFSKVLFPGLRTAYVVPPHGAGMAIRATLESIDRGPGAVEQRALALFIEQGHFERHLRRLRLAFAERQAAFIEALRRELPGFLTVEPAPAGTHLVATLSDERWSATELARVLMDAGVAVEPMAFSRIAPAPDNQILLQYTRHSVVALRAAAQLIGDVITRAGSRRIA